MDVVTGILIAPSLQLLPTLVPTTALAVSGEGIVLTLQAVAYVLVSLAAVAVLLRLGLQRNRHGEQHGCGCRNSDAHVDAAAARAHGKGHDAPGRCCNGASHEAASTSGAHPPHSAHRLRFDSAAATSCEDALGGEPRSLACGRLPDHCELPPPFAIKGRDRQDGAPATAGNAVATTAGGSASESAGAQLAGAEAADERRRVTAVIAAAVHNALGGQRHRIIRIEPVGHGWAQEGRRDIFSSHRIR